MKLSAEKMHECIEESKFENQMWKIYGVSRTDFYDFKRKYSGMTVSQIQMVLDLLEKNKQLENKLAELDGVAEAIEDLKKNFLQAREKISPGQKYLP